MGTTTRRTSDTSATHDFECSEPGCGFVSTGWETKGKRDARGRLHKTEHESGEAMPELAEFRKDNS